MGLIHDFRVEEIAKGSNRWQALVQVSPGGVETPLTDVGFGVSQVLPVVTLLQYVPEGSTVILEQPEIHLHPLA
jgi:predicted ATPase